MPQVEVKSLSTTDFKQEIKTASHHTLSADAPKHAGGNEDGPDPHELLLSALGACTSITLQMYAKRKGWDLKSVQVKLSHDNVEDEANPGKQIAKISRDITVEGNLDQEQVDSLKAIANKCPIHKLLEGPKVIATEIAHPAKV
jgi:putative redox protein